MRKLTLKEKVLQRAKKDKKKTLKHSVIVLLISGVLMFSYPFFFKSSAIELDSDSEVVFTASFVGDIMFGRHVEAISDRHGQEYLFRNVKPILLESDYVTGNFEHPVVLGEDYEKANKYIHLKTTPESVETLKNLNFSVLTIANNHTMDYQEAGLRDTIMTFEKFGMDYVGAGMNLEEASKISYQKINGIKVASIGITDSYNKEATALIDRAGVLSAAPDVVLPLIKKADSKADLVVVNIHWGQEYDNDPSPRQQELARAMVDAGADIIIGHHPHVLSKVEVYNNSIIFYSLGNFVFDQGWSRTKDSALVSYKLYEDGTGRFEIIPLRIKEASPSPIGAAGAVYKHRIFSYLTNDTPDEHWKKEDGKLIFELDHSHVLKGAK